jgi:hypothetical protein
MAITSDDSPIAEESASEPSARKRSGHGTTSGPGGKGGSRTRNIVVATLGALIAALTAVAAANDDVTRMFRNSPGAAFTALALVVVAILGEVLGRVFSDNKALLTVGAVALAAALVVGLYAEIQALHLSDRPKISLTVTQSPEEPAAVKVEAESSKALAHDQIVVSVFGETKESESRLQAIYYAKTGPDTDGNMTQDISVSVNSDKYRGVYVTAAIVPESVEPWSVDCNGVKMAPDGTTATTLDEHGKPILDDDGKPQKVYFRPSGLDPLVSCATAEFLGPMNSTTSTTTAAP